ncbi:MAG: IS66 family transposase [Acidimicrobiales bacterium]
MAPASDDNLAVRVAQLEVVVAKLQAEMVRKDTALIWQKDRIAELEKALGESHRRQKRPSAPFSKGAPKAAAGRPGRKSGEAHGRHGQRSVPPGPPDRDLVAPLPRCCPDCGGEVCHDRDEEQWQVEVPDPKVVTTRFRVAVGHCGRCARRLQGRHPEQVSDALGAAGIQIGPRAKALGAWLHYGLGLSFGRVGQVLGHLGLPVSRAAICRSAARSACTDLVVVHHDVVVRAKRAPTLVMDESGWRVGGEGKWLWVAANAEITLAWIGDGRGFEAASEVIAADYSGVLVRDGYIVYDHYTAATHQSCTAHVLRRCHQMEADLAATDAKVPAAAKAIIKDALAARDLPTPAERAAAATECRARLDALCARPTSCDANRRLLKHLAHQADALFTFLTIDGVDATNFRGEQAVRPCVVNRKTWGGNRTWAGASTQGTLTSIIATAAKHGIDAVDYLAARARAPDPGLAILLG